MIATISGRLYANQSSTSVSDLFETIIQWSNQTKNHDDFDLKIRFGWQTNHFGGDHKNRTSQSAIYCFNSLDRLHHELPFELIDNFVDNVQLLLNTYSSKSSDSDHYLNHRKMKMKDKFDEKSSREQHQMIDHHIYKCRLDQLQAFSTNLHFQFNEIKTLHIEVDENSFCAFKANKNGEKTMTNWSLCEMPVAKQVFCSTIKKRMIGQNTTVEQTNTTSSKMSQIVVDYLDSYSMNSISNFSCTPDFAIQCQRKLIITNIETTPYTIIKRKSKRYQFIFGKFATVIIHWYQDHDKNKDLMMPSARIEIDLHQNEEFFENISQQIKFQNDKPLRIYCSQVINFIQDTLYLFTKNPIQRNLSTFF